MSKKHPRKSASAPPLSPDERVRIDSLLEGLSGTEPSALCDRLENPKIAAAFVENLPLDYPEAVTLLNAVQEKFPQKEVRKAVRKAVFRLRQRGIDVPDRRKEEPSPFVAARSEQSQAAAFINPPDGLGNRAVIIEITRFPAGVDLGMGIASDEKGLLEFLFGRYSRKKAKEMKELFFQSVSELQETSIEHAATVLESAYQKSKGGTNRSISEYLELRPWLLENVVLLKTPLIHDLIPPGSVSDPDLTGLQIHRLLAHQWTKTWIIHPDDIKPLIEEILNVRQSPILVSAEQKAARVEDLKRAFLLRTYTDDKRAAVTSRLEEIAYLFHKSGEEDFAVLALKAALSMKEKDSTFKTNSFLSHMLEHSLTYYMGQMEENSTEAAKQESSPGLILPG
ncbi:MAG: hypothetical protein C4576_34350 [Desulfobacteraceae bacterium]|nr:MAG: hypothetical protein C4576_34350 [Desulfobacteraceae bacterium]